MIRRQSIALLTLAVSFAGVALACVGDAPDRVGSTPDGGSGGGDDAATPNPQNEGGAVGADGSDDASLPPPTGKTRWAKHFRQQPAVTAATQTYGSTAIDKDGNVFVATSFTGTTDVGSPAPSAFAPSTKPDVLVVKYSPAGTVLWAKGYGGNENDFVYSIAADSNGDLWVAGTTHSTSPGGAFTPGTKPVPDPWPYLAKLSGKDGSVAVTNVLDVDEVGGIGRCNAVAANAAGRIAATCNFNGKIGFTKIGAASPTMMNTTGGETDIVVVELDTNGKAHWGTKLGANEREDGLAIAINAGGDVLVGGVFDGPNMAVPFLERLGDGPNAFAVKLAAGNGGPSWAKQFAPKGASSNVYIDGVAFDPGGDARVVGTFIGSVDFGKGSPVAQGADIFVLALDNAASGATQWQKVIGGTGVDESRAVAVDPLGHLTVTGIIRSQNVFVENKPIPSAPGSEVAFFAVKWATDGAILWAKGVAGTGAGSDLGGVFVRNVAVGPDRSLALGGTLVGPADLGDGLPITTTGNGDNFVLSWAP